MSNEELCKALRKPWFTNGCEQYQLEAADQIEALVKERDEARDAAVVWQEEFVEMNERWANTEIRLTKAVEALREISAEASVRVEVKKRGSISHKKLYKGWRKIATDRIDIARAVLAEIGGEA